jgi:hypothetical protein
VRIYEILPLICPACDGEMRLIAFVTEVEPVLRILAYLHRSSNSTRR